MTLSQFIHQLTAGDVVPANDPQQRWHPQVIHETDEEEYDYYLDMLPPRYVNGSYFCFGEGAGPFRLFWERGGRYFGREMNMDETEQFCQLARVRLHA